MENNVTKVIGYILLSPALISVILFIIQLRTDTDAFDMETGDLWTGYGYGYGYTSALPFYFGLMALAGAYLIKDKK
jgi:phosphoglycerol transferase MdoB-like AlkP superfamily enzyme